MKTIFAFLIFTFSALGVSAQETVKIVDATKKSYTKEIYYVLKKDKSVKHGPYQKFGYKDRLEITGYYKNGEKDSLWTEYRYDGIPLSQNHYQDGHLHGLSIKYYNSGIKNTEGFYKRGVKDSIWITYSTSGVLLQKDFYRKDNRNGLSTSYYNNEKIESKGEYYNNKKTGIWEFYNPDGSLMQKYDYDKKELLYIEKVPNQQLTVKTDSGSITINVERIPTFIGGIQEFMRHIQSNVKYPELAMDNGVEGNVIVAFVVEKDGTVSNVEVEKPVGYGLDKESIRVIQLTSGSWLPAIHDGEISRVKFSAPIRFILGR